LADQQDKAHLMRYIKLFEIVVMLNGALAFFIQSTDYLLVVLFLMGVKSAFFGPVKYSIIPQHLYPLELVSGNAWVEAGTFVAILLGAIATGFLAHLENASFWVACSVVLFAVLGWFSSLFILKAPSSNPQLKLDFRFFYQIKETLRITRREHSVYSCILCISWFWFLGASYLTQMLQLTKMSLHADEGVATFLLILFSIGIAIGSLLCELVKHKVHLGLVLISGVGISILGGHLSYVFSLAVLSLANTTVISIDEMFKYRELILTFLDVLFIGVFGGLYIVPLYAWIQQYTPAEFRSRLVAGNNIFNALLMVLSALFGMLILSVFELSLSVFFALLSVVNLFVLLGFTWYEKKFFFHARDFILSFRHR
jgi:MFS family permease